MSRWEIVQVLLGGACTGAVLGLDKLVRVWRAKSATRRTTPGD